MVFVNRETGSKRHLRSLDALSGLLVWTKCICGRGCAPNPTRELTALLPPASPLIKNSFPALGLEFRPFAPQEWEPTKISQKNAPTPDDCNAHE